MDFQHDRGMSWGRMLWCAFWRSIALFAYRRWVTPGEPKPWGVPGNRDPDHPCEVYSPRKWRPGDWNDCQTDGHALCVECCHRIPDPVDGEPVVAYTHRQPTGVAERDADGDPAVIYIKLWR